MIGILNSSFTDKESIIDYLIPESKSVLDNLTDGTRYRGYYTVARRYEFYVRANV